MSMSNVSVQDKNLEKQMGCMAGFFQIFDRTQIRLYTAKRLPPSSAVHSDKKIGSPPPGVGPDPMSATESLVPAAAGIAPRSPLPLPVFEFKEGTRSSWKFSREAPRLSLDSRATVDAKGSLYPKEIRTNAAIISANRRSVENASAGDDDADKNRRSPSVVARLMGLEPITNSDPELPKKAELRRSASESRVSKDLYQYRFAEGNAFQSKQSQQSLAANSSGNVVRDLSTAKYQDRGSNLRPLVSKTEPVNKAQNRGIGVRKSYFDSADFFPEPKQTMTVYGEIEKRLRMRGIDEPSKDLETLKQILEALQLKGLLHQRKAMNQFDYRNFVYERNSFSHDESPIIVMKPTSRSPRFGNESPPPPSSLRSSRPGSQRTPSETLQAQSPRRDRGSRNHSPNRSIPSQTTRTENNLKSPNRRRPLSIETQRKGNDAAAEQRRVSPVNSPKINSRRSNVSDQRSPRNRKATVEINSKKEPKMLLPIEDESSTMSESTSTDTERAKTEEYNKDGRSLLERCDKLLHSIAEITVAELQPSPVSVLDSSFYKDESSTSPIMKRSIGFKVEMEDEMWESAISSPVESDFVFESSEDCDLIYISEILRASNYMPDDSDIFQLLEKKQYVKGNDTSRVSRLQRRLIFDTITEIQNRNRLLPPSKAVCGANSSIGQASLRQVWTEFRRIRERDDSEDLFEVICGVLRKDLAGDTIHEWGDSPIEVSEAVLDIERLVFKDLIGEIIRDLAAYSATKYFKPLPSCRKLVF